MFWQVEFAQLQTLPAEKGNKMELKAPVSGPLVMGFFFKYDFFRIRHFQGQQ